MTTPTTTTAAGERARERCSSQRASPVQTQPPRRAFPDEDSALREATRPAAIVPQRGGTWHREAYFGGTTRPSARGTSGGVAASAAKDVWDGVAWARVATGGRSS